MFYVVFLHNLYLISVHEGTPRKEILLINSNNNKYYIPDNIQDKEQFFYDDF